MCGIVSYFSNEKGVDNKIATLMGNALWIDSIRGFHSTGIIYESAGSVEYYKKAIAGYDFVQLDQVKDVLGVLHKTPYFIGHNRAATRGEKITSNAHPFQCGHITGVHNGTIYNHTTLNKESFDVDSHSLYNAIKDKGSIEVIPKVSGGFNLLWHDDKDDTIHVLRNSDRPYTFAKIKGKETLIGMSEWPMLAWLVERAGLEVEYKWSPKGEQGSMFLLLTVT